MESDRQMANRRKTKQYKTGLRVREAETIRDNALRGMAAADKTASELMEANRQLIDENHSLEFNLAMAQAEKNTLKLDLDQLIALVKVTDDVET